MALIENGASYQFQLTFCTSRNKLAPITPKLSKPTTELGSGIDLTDSNEVDPVMIPDKPCTFLSKIPSCQFVLNK